MLRSYQVTPPRSSRFAWARRLTLLLFILLSLPFLLAVAYRVIPPPMSALMALRMIGGHSTDYRWRPIEQISPHLIHAVAAAEDAGICRHDGVDWDVLRGLAKQALDEDGKPVRGGSTIAMQTAKNLFLWPQRSYIRKAAEIPLSLWIGYIWPRQRIMEVYLNIAEWGSGIYGAEAASRRHFGISAAKLSAREAALLAAALPNPILYNAGKPGPQLRRKARRVQARMRGAGAYLKCLR